MSPMTTTRIISMAAALALLSIVACKKTDTTTPTDGTATDVDDDAATDAGGSADDDASEPEQAILSKGSFDETINDHMQEVSDCYVAALEGNPELAGKLDAEFTFGADGVPTSVVAADGSTLTDEGLVQCIGEAAKGWGFGVPKEDGMKLRYQFNLAPAS